VLCAILKKKNGGPSPRFVDHARLAGPRVHCGPHSGRRSELTGTRPSGRSGARWLAAEAREARGWRGDPNGGLTSGGGVARRASGGGERSSVVVLSVRGARGEKVKRGSEDERGGVGLGQGRVS
jgi:hypothetical protein